MHATSSVLAGQVCKENNRAKDARSIALPGVVETSMKWAKAVDG